MGNSDRKLKKNKKTERKREAPKREIIGECVPCEGIYAIALIVSGSGECHAPSSSSFLFFVLFYFHLSLTSFCKKHKGFFVFSIIGGNPAPSKEYDEN